MRRYFYAGPVCPSCGYPYSTKNFMHNSPLCINARGMYVCPNPDCSAEFWNGIDVSHLAEAVNQNLPFVEKSGDCYRVPLYRECVLNNIELEYVEWIKDNPEGGHLILWPFSEVRFLPVLATEYIKKFPKKKIVIVGDYSCDSSATPTEIISKLFSIDYSDDKERLFKSHLLSDTKKLKSEIFRKSSEEDKEKQVTIISPSEHSSRKIIYRSGTYGDVKKELIRELKDEYGSQWDGCIIYAPNKEPDVKYYNENGNNLKISITESVGRWSGEKVQYNIQWMDDVCNSLDSVEYCSDILHPAIYSVENNKNITDTESNLIYLILGNYDDVTKQNELFEIIQDLSPDLLIFANTDKFTTYNTHSQKIINSELLKLVENNRTVLFFSTNRELRQCYMFDKPDFRFGKDILVTHSVDTDEVIADIANAAKYSSIPYSPLFTEAKKKSYYPEIKYISYSPVDTNSLYEIINKIPDYMLRKYITGYVNELCISLLNPKSDKYWIGYQSITWEYLASQLQQRIDDDDNNSEIYNDVLDAIKGILNLHYSEGRNPFRSKIIEKAEEICDKSSKCEIIYATGSSAKYINNTISKDPGIPNRIKERLEAKEWKKIFSELRHTKPYPTYIISSTYPPYEFHLDSEDMEKIKEIKFVADEKRLEKINTILNNRIINKSIVQPVILPEGIGTIPAGLHNLLSTIPKKEQYNDNLENLKKTMDDEELEYYCHSQRQNNNQSSYESESVNLAQLKQGDEVILAINSEGRGVFLSKESSVMYVNTDGLFDDFNIKSDKKNKYKNLNGKEIILSMNSYKKIFLEYMLEHQANFKTRRAEYEWKTFDDLCSDSISWIQFIETAKENITNEGEREIDILNNIIKLFEMNGLKKDVMTLKSWLRKDDELTIDSISYPIYAVERPRDVEDLRVVYNTLKDYVPNASNYDLVKSYYAVKQLQEIRRKVRKPAAMKNDPLLLRIGNDLKNKSKEILKDAEIFTPVRIELQTLACNVYPKKIFENYEDFI